MLFLTFDGRLLPFKLRDIVRAKGSSRSCYVVRLDCLSTSFNQQYCGEIVFVFEKHLTGRVCINPLFSVGMPSALFLPDGATHLDDFELEFSPVDLQAPVAKVLLREIRELFPQRRRGLLRTRENVAGKYVYTTYAAKKAIALTQAAEEFFLFVDVNRDDGQGENWALRLDGGGRITDSRKIVGGGDLGVLNEFRINLRWSDIIYLGQGAAEDMLAHLLRARSKAETRRHTGSR